jgi:threonine/homoserine/homoserine lactone efflux protein
MFWLLPLLKGISQGVVISLLSFGPSFFTLVHTGIQGGKRAGMIMAMGIFLSEMTVALTCFFGLSHIFTYPEFQLVFSFVAALAILFLGVKGFIKNYDAFLKSIQAPLGNSHSFFKGFITNLMNPFVIFLWVGLLAAVSVSYNQHEPNYRYEILVNLLAILITLFCMDMGKVVLSDYLGRKLSNRVYFYVNKYFGLILLLIGAYFFYHFCVLLIDYTGIGRN